MTETRDDEIPDDWNDLGRVWLYRTRGTHMALLLATIVICEGFFVYYQPENWSLFRTLLGGFLTGIWCYMCIFINWILVADW